MEYRRKNIEVPDTYPSNPSIHGIPPSPPRRIGHPARAAAARGGSADDRGGSGCAQAAGVGRAVQGDEAGPSGGREAVQGRRRIPQEGLGQEGWQHAQGRGAAAAAQAPRVG